MKNKMREINKRLLYLAIMVIAIFGLVGCNAAKESKTIDEEALADRLTGTINNVAAMAVEPNIAKVLKESDLEDIKATLKANEAPFSAEALISGIDGYNQILEESGKLKDIKDISFTAIDNGVKGVAVCQFGKRIVNVNVIFNERNIIQTISFAPEYTMGEIANKAVMNTIIGMGMVFAILAFIAFIISLLKYIPQPDMKKAEPSVAPLVQSTAPAEKENLTENAALVAVITAAIVEYESLPDDSSFVVRTINRRSENRW